MPTLTKNLSLTTASRTMNNSTLAPAAINPLSFTSQVEKARQAIETLQAVIDFACDESLVLDKAQTSQPRVALSFASVSQPRDSFFRPFDAVVRVRELPEIRTVLHFPSPAVHPHMERALAVA